VPNSDLPFRDLEDDRLHLPTVKEHSLEKIVRHNYYAEMFATGMKNMWPQLAYVGLYAGAGRARLDPSGEIIETSAMCALRLPHRFTKYIFVDADPRCTLALSQRIERLPYEPNVSVLTGDANEMLPDIRAALPTFGPGNGLLSLCFVDPFACNIRFSTIRELARFRMDFLLLLMLGRDVRANFRLYFDDLSSTRIADLIDCPDWRNEFQLSSDRNIVRFLLRKFDRAMRSLGYRAANPADYHRVVVPGKNVMQYMLVLYSKHEMGQQYWKATLGGTSRQTAFDLD
jgi:three-Cys-motif partner protein